MLSRNIYTHAIEDFKLKKKTYSRRVSLNYCVTMLKVWLKETTNDCFLTNFQFTLSYRIKIFSKVQSDNVLNWVLRTNHIIKIIKNNPNLQACKSGCPNNTFNQFVDPSRNSMHLMYVLRNISILELERDINVVDKS